MFGSIRLSRSPRGPLRSVRKIYMCVPQIPSLCCETSVREAGPAARCVVWTPIVFPVLQKAARPFCLWYLVWPVSSHHCSFVFGRASGASMETGRRAVCARPGHLAAQRGRGRGGRWSRGSGSAGKRDIFPPPPFFFFVLSLCVGPPVCLWTPPTSGLHAYWPPDT